MFFYFLSEKSQLAPIYTSVKLKKQQKLAILAFKQRQKKFKNVCQLQ